MMPKRKKKKERKELREELSVEDLIAALKVKREPVSDGIQVLDNYPLKPPFLSLIHI